METCSSLACTSPVGSTATRSAHAQSGKSRSSKGNPQNAVQGEPLNNTHHSSLWNLEFYNLITSLYDFKDIMIYINM